MAYVQLTAGGGVGGAYIAGDNWTPAIATQVRDDLDDHEARLIALGDGLPLAQIFRSSTTLTDAQVKALPATPITLVAAPGASFYIRLHQVEIQTKFAAGAYTNIDATYAALGVALGNGGAASGAAPSMLVADDVGQTPAMTLLTKLFSASSRCLPLLPYLESNPAYVNPGSADGTYAIDLITDVANAPLTISASNGATNTHGDFTGGNAGNSMKVIVYYTKEAVP